LRSITIAQVVDEYFQSTTQKKANINDVLKHYLEKYGESDPAAIKRARNSIYLKIHRLVKSGQLVVVSKIGKNSYYGQPGDLKEAKKQIKTPITSVKSEKEILLRRKTELEYELELCIAELQGYEEIKKLLPNQLDLLTSKKNAVKKRVIKLNGLLTSTQSILHALS
jgi:hypothetical protein